MANDKGGGGIGELIFDLLVGGAVVAGGIALVSVLAEESEKKNKLALAGGEPPKQLPPLSDDQMKEAVRRLAQIRKDDPAAWAREVSRDPELTNLVLQWQARERRIFEGESDLGKPLNPKQAKPNEPKATARPWYEEMHAEEKRIKELYPNEADHGPMIEMLRRKYMEGEY